MGIIYSQIRLMHSVVIHTRHWGNTLYFCIANVSSSVENGSSWCVVLCSEGWEKLGLFEFFKAKQKAKKMKDEMARRQSNSRSASPRRRRRTSRRHSQSR